MQSRRRDESGYSGRVARVKATPAPRQTWDPVRNKLSLGQVVVDGKSNAITAIPERLRLLEVTGAVATIDAMLYECNDRRLETPRATPRFAACDQEARRCVAAMDQQREQELAQAELHPARRKVLESLRQHRGGLTVFVEHPEAPMDNNTAERLERGPVAGRKNYYGSGAVWSGRLAAMLFSLFQTLALWGINPQVWLTAYL